MCPILVLVLVLKVRVTEGVYPFCDLWHVNGSYHPRFSPRKTSKIHLFMLPLVTCFPLFSPRLLSRKVYSAQKTQPFNEVAPEIRLAHQIMNFLAVVVAGFELSFLQFKSLFVELGIRAFSS